MTFKLEFDASTGQHLMIVEARPGHWVPVLDRHGAPFDFTQELQAAGPTGAQAFVNRVAHCVTLPTESTK